MCTNTCLMCAPEKLADTAAKIAINNFEWRYITLVFFNSTMVHGIVKDFLQLYNKSVIISKGLTEPKYAATTQQYVIFGRDISDIIYMLDWMEGYKFDNTGRYVVVCHSLEESNCNETEAVNTFWFHKIINVIFLKYIEDSVIGYTYFYNTECVMSAPVEMKTLHPCLENMELQCVLYPEKFRNLHRCPLIASTFIQPPYMSFKNEKPSGSNGDLLLIIAEALNATLQMMLPYRGDGWGNIDDKGMWVGSLGDVYYDLANISITSAAATLSRVSNFQLSFNYDFITLGWITSPTELQSSSLKLLHPFRKNTHIAVGITFILAFVAAMLIKSRLLKRVRRKLKMDMPENVIFSSWTICLGIPMHRMPKKSFFLHIVFIWIWYTFLVRTMYQAALINSLKSNVYASNVDNVEQILAAELKFGGGSALRDYFKNYPEVYDSFIGMNATELVKLIKRVSKGEEFAVTVNLELVDTILKNSSGKVHVLSEKVVVSPTAFFYKKFSPLADPIDNILQKLTEAGFPDKFHRNYFSPLNKKLPTRKDNKAPITLSHYTGCYAILFVGWSVSVIFFFCEIGFALKNK